MRLINLNAIAFKIRNWFYFSDVLTFICTGQLDYEQNFRYKFSLVTIKLGELKYNNSFCYIFRIFSLLIVLIIRLF